MTMYYHAPPVAEPKRRSPLRRRFGREVFILRRHLQLRTGGRLAHDRSADDLDYEVLAHRSMLLRPLQGVDMQLQVNKITNLQIACGRIDRLVIAPGERFSLWHLVGRPTARRGYLDGLVLDAGRIRAGVGGGLCQLGNLLYWMLIQTPLTVTERWRHGYDVFPDVNRRLPFGSGATLSYNYVDLGFENRTTEHWQIRLGLDATHLHGAIRCQAPCRYDYRIEETDHHVRPEWWGGYTRHNRIWREIEDRQTGEIRRELVTANHAIMMYEPLLPESPIPSHP